MKIRAIDKVNFDFLTRGYVIRKLGRAALLALKSHGNGKRGAYAACDVFDYVEPSK